MMCSNVDLPQPDGPIRAMNSPWPTEKLMSRNAARPCDVNRFSRPSIRRVLSSAIVEPAFLVEKPSLQVYSNPLPLGMCWPIADRRTMGMALRAAYP
jgi:hypothetical protein